MKKYKNVIIYTFLFVLFMALAIYGYNFLNDKYSSNNIEQNNELQSLTKATDFRIVDFSGDETKLSDYYGKPIVVNFWDIGCGPCLMELPAFNNAYQKYSNRVEFLMVNLIDPNRQSTEHIKKFLTENNYQFPNFFDIDYNATIAYSIYSIPRTLFIDESGNITFSQIGMLTEAKLNNYIENLIKQ